MWDTPKAKAERERRHNEAFFKLARMAERRSEIGWLIEAEGRDGRPVFFTLERDDDGEWTPDLVKALRFARKIDADNYAASHLDGKETPCRVTDHIWD